MESKASVFLGYYGFDMSLKGSQWLLCWLEYCEQMERYVSFLEVFRSFDNSLAKVQTPGYKRAMGLMMTAVRNANKDRLMKLYQSPKKVAEGFCFENNINQKATV